jgi:uncharacterized membrane protein
MFAWAGSVFGEYNHMDIGTMNVGIVTAQLDLFSQSSISAIGVNIFNFAGPRRHQIPSSRSRHAVGVIASSHAKQEALPGVNTRSETHTRSVLKAVSWRTLGTLDAFAISWFLTGKVQIAGSIAALEIITKTGWYYLHERLWSAFHGDGGIEADFGLTCEPYRASRRRQASTKTSAPLTMSTSAVFSVQ